MLIAVAVKIRLSQQHQELMLMLRAIEEYSFYIRNIKAILLYVLFVS